MDDKSWLQNLKVGDKVALSYYRALGARYTVATVESLTKTEVRLVGDSTKYRRDNGWPKGDRGRASFSTPPYLVEYTDEVKLDIAKAARLNRCENAKWKELPEELVKKVSDLLREHYAKETSR